MSVAPQEFVSAACRNESRLPRVSEPKGDRTDNVDQLLAEYQGDGEQCQHRPPELAVWTARGAVAAAESARAKAFGGGDGVHSSRQRWRDAARQTLDATDGSAASAKFVSTSRRLMSHLGKSKRGETPASDLAQLLSADTNGEHISIAALEGTFNKHVKALTEKQAHFPVQHTVFPVFSPHTRIRVAWDMFMFCCTCFVMIVTPFELTFVAQGDKQCSSMLFMMNTVINFAFFVDMVIMFNTSYFNPSKGSWVMDRRQIARLYLRTWFLADIISIIPVECVRFGNASSNAARYARLARALRFFKLLKVLKSPRVLVAVASHFDMSTKLQTVVKYLAMLFFTVHWSACLLRLLTLIACQANQGPHSNQKKYKKELDRDGCPNTVLTTGYNWGNGMWAVYLQAAMWSLVALNGDAGQPFQHSEVVLGIFIMLLGFILLGFLLGELTNTMTNLDPVANQFNSTRDSLHEFMARHNFSVEIRRKLRAYITLSEPVFRGNHYQHSLAKLSPRFKHIIANHVHGFSVVSMPFLEYTVQVVHGITMGTRLWVRPRYVSRRSINAHDPSSELPLPEARPAEVKRIPRYLRYDLVYLDNGEEESEVSHQRVDVSRSFQDAATQRLIYRQMYEREDLVVSIAQRLETQLYMECDVIVNRDMSTNTALYLIDSGFCLVFGAKSVQQFHCESLTGGHYFGTDTTMLLCGSKKPQLVHYSVKTVRVTHLKMILGTDLVEILTDSPSFALHLSCIKRYACWLQLKAGAIRYARETRDHRTSTLTTGASSGLCGSNIAMPFHQTPADATTPRRSGSSGACSDDAATRRLPPVVRGTSPAQDRALVAKLARHFVQRSTASDAEDAVFRQLEQTHPRLHDLYRDLGDILDTASCAAPAPPETRDCDDYDDDETSVSRLLNQHSACNSSAKLDSLGTPPQRQS